MPEGNLITREPVAFQAGVGAIAQIIMQILPQFGIMVDPQLAGAVSIVALLVGGWFARVRVSPVVPQPIAIPPSSNFPGTH